MCVFLRPDSKQARVDVRVSLIYRSIQACEEVNKVGGFKIRIVNRIKDVLDQLWGETQYSKGGFCGGRDCEDESVVKVETKYVVNRSAFLCVLCFPSIL